MPNDLAAPTPNAQELVVLRIVDTSETTKRAQLAGSRSSRGKAGGAKAAYPRTKSRQPSGPATTRFTKTTTGTRILSATVFLSVFLLLLFYAQYLFAFVVLGMMLVATVEFLRMTERVNTDIRYGGVTALSTPVLLWLCVMAGSFTEAVKIEYIGWVVALSLMLSQLLNLFSGRVINFSIRTSVNFFAGLYVAMPLCLLLYLYLTFMNGTSVLGAKLLLFLLIPTWMSDSAAYFVGIRFGKNKLAPTISPNKTIEGFFGGLAGSLIAAVLFWWWCLPELHGGDVNILGANSAILVGLIVGVFGPAGDLAESALKREARIKDSGNFLPGHGGVLDKIDSLTFSSVFFFWLCYSKIPVEIMTIVN